MDTVRVLVIGVGGITRYRHIPELEKVAEAQIVGLVDPAQSALQAAVAAFPNLAAVPTFADHRQALAAVEADAAVIASPHSQHLEQGTECIEAGLHVLMEKPFVVGGANAARLIACAQHHRRHLAIAYQRHVEGAYRYLHDLVREGELGTIRSIAAYQAQRWLALTPGTWRQDPAISGGGQLNDSGSHLLDAILWITGLQPESVSAQIDARGTEVDIDSSLIVRFHGGALASILVAGSASIDWWEDISLAGDRGMALYRNGQLWVARAGEHMPVCVPPEQIPPSSTLARDFVDLILGRVAAPAAPAAGALMVARLTEAAWRSAAIGQPVTFPPD
jgi:predicted dehydrogenase